MDINKQKDIFRLAAVLYADNNYDVNPKTIHKKIIESVFLDNNNSELTINEILNWIEINYNFVFDSLEVENIITNEKNEVFYIGKNKTNELTISLTPKRIEVLQNKIKKNNIDFFIDEFSKINSDFPLNDLKIVIYKFLYEVLNTNIMSFSKLLNSENNISDLIKISNGTFNQIEIEIINSFLQWDNNDKNKIIFDISSYALEYCLITNNNSSATFHLNNLKNKQFYLDTNIIFRAIGINGENRQKRTLTFLKKFSDAGENLLISKFSESEIKSTLRYYVTDLDKKISARINPKVFIKYKLNSDFFDYYHKWRINRSNDSLELFEAFVLNEIDNLKKNLKISTDYVITFDETDEKITKKIEELASNIHSYKSSQNFSHIHFESCLWDAKNIFLVNSKRDGNYKSIFETKYYFISSDQSLRKWDYINNKSTPTVILPSQWLSILLRYVQRTNDDFKSFVSFLNLSQSETSLSNEKLQFVLLGISEITLDFEKQSSIIGIMVENKFKGILDQNTTDEEIVEKARDFAKSKLEEELENIKKQNEKLSTQFDSHKKSTKTAIKTLQDLKNEELNKSKSIENENNRLKRELREKYISTEILKWRIVPILLIILSCICIFLYLLLFIYENSSWNYVTNIKNWINSLPEDSLQKNIAFTIYAIPLGIFIPTYLITKDRFFNKNKKNEKIKSIEENLPNHIKI